MVNANRKGRDAENRLATFLRVRGWKTELPRLAGTDDRGDLWLPPLVRFIEPEKRRGDGMHEVPGQRVEVKAHDNIVSGLNEAMKDVDKLRKLFPDDDCWGVIRRPGQPTGEWYAVKRVKDVWPDLNDN